MFDDVHDGENIVLGINEGNLSQFAMDIVSLNDTISELFTSIDNKMCELKSVFDCNSYEKLFASYDSFKKNYSVVKKNISSYSNDLIGVVNKVKSGDKHIVFLINEITDIVSDEAKSVESL